jgi:YD repeat-containing protein
MTIAQQLKIKSFPFIIKNSDGKLIYFEQSSGEWTRNEYDDKGRVVYYENSSGFWHKYVHDDDGNVIFQTNSSGYWAKNEYGIDGAVLYHEDSKNGVYLDFRSKSEVQKAIELLTKEGLIVDGKILKA